MVVVSDNTPLELQEAFVDECVSGLELIYFVWTRENWSCYRRQSLGFWSCGQRGMNQEIESTTTAARGAVMMTAAAAVCERQVPVCSAGYS